jgi:hypothetical protein
MWLNFKRDVLHALMMCYMDVLMYYMHVLMCYMHVLMCLMNNHQITQLIVKNISF